MVCIWKILLLFSYQKSVLYIMQKMQKNCQKVTLFLQTFEACSIIKRPIDGLIDSKVFEQQAKNISNIFVIF
jgi:hypothetical protein